METEKEKAKAKGAKTYKLRKPIQFGEETITELNFQEPKAKHIKDIKNDMSIGDILKIAAKLTGVSTSALDEMSSKDVTEVTNIVGELL